MEKYNYKIVFMGTPNFAVSTLKSIYNSGYNVKAVITQQDKRKGRGKKIQYTPVKEEALKLGIEVFQPENINDKETINILKDINPDFIVVVAYGQILKSEILEIPKYGCYNVHASLLPKYRGAAPINWAIINGERETGVTIMEMEKGLDTGDIILSSAIKINTEDNTEDIHGKLSLLGGELIDKALENIIKGDFTKEKQNHANSSYASMLNKEMGRIDWDDSGENIINLIRGLKPWPSAYTNYREEVVKIHKASFLGEEIDGMNGEIKKIDKDGLYIKVKDGIIKLEELQFPGKKKLLVKEYLKGNSIREGEVLR